MKRIFSIVIISLFTISTIAQSKKDAIIIVQKFYYDTLQTNYRKVKFEMNKKADKAKRMDYSSAHISDTLIVRETTKYIYENGYFVSPDHRNSKELKNTEIYKVGDTIFEKKTDYLTKKVYFKNKIVYAARLFPEQLIIPYNERKYIYNKVGELIEIKEKHNSLNVSEEYKIVFDYTDDIVSRMTEFKMVEKEWKKEKVWEYDLLTNNNIRKKIKKRINILLLGNQFLQTPW